MTTADPFEIKFLKSMERARRVAARLLRSDLGAHTHEDVLSILIEKELKAGRCESEILEMLDSPGLYWRLANVKNDIFRWETAVKRGRGELPVPLEDAELFLATTTDDPESEMIRKEGCVYRNDVLNRLLEKARLSETQLEILKLDWGGYTSQEIAGELGIHVNVVYARRSEAMRKLVAAARCISRIEK